MKKELLNSVDLTNKILALSLLMLVFALTTCLLIVTLLLSYQHLCRSKDRKRRQRKPTPEFVSWVQKNLSKPNVRRQKSGASVFRDNKIIKHELRPVPRPKFSEIWLYRPQIRARDTLEYVSRWFRTFLRILIFRFFSVSLCVKYGRRLRTAMFWTLYFNF